jgi:hypothetical protein
MKLWKKIALSILFILIPAPDVEIIVKIDMNHDDKPDVVLRYRDLDFDVKRNY